jgi:Ni/Co efflux regulator RcnB
MRTLILTLAAATALTAGSASAQAYGRHNNDWMSINQRQQMLDQRIDQGTRSGQLTRSEARRLRTEFRRIARLEARYRSHGLSSWERADLDRRFDALQAQIRFERRDGDRTYGYNTRR